MSKGATMSEILYWILLGCWILLGIFAVYCLLEGL